MPPVAATVKEVLLPAQTDCAIGWVIMVGGTVHVTVKFAVVAHCPVVGVKIYVVVAVLLRAGDHVPVIPLFEVVGKALKVAPEQIADTGVNVGVIFGFTVIVKLSVVLQCLAVVVKGCGVVTGV